MLAGICNGDNFVICPYYHVLFREDNKQSHINKYNIPKNVFKMENCHGLYMCHKKKLGAGLIKIFMHVSSDDNLAWNFVHCLHCVYGSETNNSTTKA